MIKLEELTKDQQAEYTIYVEMTNTYREEKKTVPKEEHQRLYVILGLAGQWIKCYNMGFDPAQRFLDMIKIVSGHGNTD